MSAPTRTEFLPAASHAASPSKYQMQRLRLEQWAQRRAEQIVFCQWIAKELGADLTTTDIGLLVDEYSKPQKTTPAESVGVE